MEPVKISATELRQKTRDLMERVHYHGEHLIIENFHRPIAVMISYEDYLRVRDVITGPTPSLVVDHQVGENKKP